MTYNRYKFEPEWKDVKGRFTRDYGPCPRCKNDIPFKLVYEGDGIGFPGIWTFKYNKFYAFKCQICPHYFDIPVEVAKAIIKG